MKSGTTRSNYSLKSLMMSGCAALALWLVGGPAFAQTAPATDQAQADEADNPEEIVVTLDRREQKLQDYAGTAVVKSQDELDKLGVGFDFQSIQQIVPALNISFNEGFSEIYLRGIGTQDNSSTSEQPTAVHYNGVYIPRSRGIGPEFFDLARIEVNVGPQGTVRGRNATAGTINIIPQAAKLGTYEAKGSFGFGSFNLREYEAVINVPIGEKLAVRGAYFARNHDNYFTNALEGQTFAFVDGAGSEDENAFRFSVLYTPTSKLIVKLVYDNLRQGGTGFAGNFQGQAQSNGVTPQNNPINPRLQNFLTPGDVSVQLNSINGTVNYDFGKVQTEFIAGYRRYNNTTINQRRPFQYGTPNPFALPGDIDAILTFDPDNFNTNYISDFDETLTLEGRIYSPDSARFRWAVGGFYLNENQAEFRWDTSDRQFFFNNLGGPDFFATGNDSYSFYGDGTFDVTEKFRFKAGLRYTKDNKIRTGYEVQFNFNPALFTDFNNDGVRDANDLRFSTPGFQIVRAGDQRLLDPATATVADFFNNFVARFGARDTVDNVLATNPTNAAVITSTSNLGLFTQRVNTGYYNWRVGAEYDLSPDHLLYGTISTGTRSAGINNPIVVAGQRINETFSPERLLAFEAGSKNTWRLGSTLINANLTGFYYRFRDQVLQVAATADGGGFEPGAVNVNANLQVQNINAGRSRIFGITFDGNARFAYGFVASYDFTYLNAKFVEASVSDGRQLARDTNGDGVPDLAPPNVSVAGNRLLFTSPVQFNVSFGQDLTVPWGSAYWRFTTSYRGEYFATPFNSQGFTITGAPTDLANVPILFQGVPGQGDGRFFNDRTAPFALFNVTYGTKFGPDERFLLEGYVNNASNTAYNQRQIINAFVNIGFINPPRVIGGRLTAKF